MRRFALVVTIVLAAGCAPALREPPSVAVLAKKPAPPMPPMPKDAGGLLREADARWAKRPDAGAVREAESLYLQAAEADPNDITALIGATRTKVWLLEHNPEAGTRGDLATSAVQTAQWCGRRAPDEPTCDYWLAIAVGVQAREVRQTADDGMKTMVAELSRAVETVPGYDSGGPERVMALLLLRAPGWPLGPGDPESALQYARKAVAAAPEHPPNLLVLGEALSANKRKEEARAAYRKASDLARSRAAAGDPDAPEWVLEAENDLKP